MPALVTIAIPCRNASQWIGAAIRSALDQDWPATEVIVVDDGSTDDSREVARGFGDRVRVLEGAHRGSNAARNTALEAARGDWVQFLDADDYLLPAKLSQQLAAPGDEDVIFSPVWVDQDGQRTASRIDPQRNLPALWLSWELPQTGGCLWRRSSLMKIGGWNAAIPCCQEYELYSRAIRAGHRFRFVESAGAVYRVWSGQTLCRKDPAQVIEVRTRLYREFIAWLRTENLLEQEHLELAGTACFEMARTLAKYRLPQAVQYHRERKREGLIHLSGPAAPRSYRVAYGALGFSFAEMLARAFRHERPIS